MSRDPDSRLGALDVGNGSASRVDDRTGQLPARQVREDGNRQTRAPEAVPRAQAYPVRQRPPEDDLRGAGAQETGRLDILSMGDNKRDVARTRRGMSSSREDAGWWNPGVRRNLSGSFRNQLSHRRSGEDRNQGGGLDPGQPWDPQNRDTLKLDQGCLPAPRGMIGGHMPIHRAGFAVLGSDQEVLQVLQRAQGIHNWVERRKHLCEWPPCAAHGGRVRLSSQHLALACKKKESGISYAAALERTQ